MNVVIYHNPRCSKSRQTLQLLKEKGIDPAVVEYLTNTPSVDKLKSILALLKMKPRDILRTGEEEYETLGLSKKTLSDDALLEIMVHNPKLIERPIVTHGDKAVIGRPPENVLDIL